MSENGKRKAGRPKLETPTANLNISVSPEMKQAIEQQAKEAGLKVSEFVRLKVFGDSRTRQEETLEEATKRAFVSALMEGFEVGITPLEDLTPEQLQEMALNSFIERFGDIAKSTPDTWDEYYKRATLLTQQHLEAAAELQALLHSWAESLSESKESTSE